MGVDGSGTISVLREIFRSRNVLVLALTSTLSMFMGSLWWPFQALYILELGASKQSLGMILTLQSVTELVIQIPGGILTDRWGRRKVIVLSTLLRLGSNLIFLSASHWTHIAPALVLGAATIMSVPASSALLAESISSENMSTGFAAIRTVAEFPMIVTSLLGGILIDRIGIVTGVRAILLAYSLVTLLSVSLQWRHITETMPTPGDAAEEKAEGRTFFESLRHLPRDVWVLSVILGVSAFSLRLFSSFTVIYAVEVVGLSTTQWGLLGTLANVVAIVFSIPGGRIADMLGKRVGILLSRIPMALAPLGYTLSSSFLHLAVVRTISGLGSGFGADLYGAQGGPLWQALIVDYTPQEERGRIMGVIGTIKSVLSVPATWIGGALYDNISPPTPFRLSFAMDVVAIAIFVLVLKPPEDRG
ncbi:MFS transporter [Candidatus Bathyarchaeota archaeon]|nr:MFS transporter [Candidatus Bathyarchaeota archaeon]